MNEPSKEGEQSEQRAEKKAEMVVLKGHRIVPLLLFGLAILVFLGSGIDWTVSKGFPMFSTGGSDFKDVDKLVKKLRSSDKKSDPVSQFLWGKFSKETQVALSSTPLTRESTEELASELNKILKSGVSIYSVQLFPKDLSVYGLESISNANEIPNKGKKNLVIVANVKGKLRFRVFDSAGEKIDYDEDFLASRKLDEQQQKILEVLKKKPEEKEVTGKEVASLLGYTGLSHIIDTAKKGTDYALLNRRLLEYTYQAEIKRGDYHDLEWFSREIGSDVRNIFKTPNQNFPIFIKTQVWTVWILGLCSLLPGVAGLIYRRAFWKWFLATFVVLYLINWMWSAIGWGAIGANLMDRKTYQSYLWVEAVLILLLLAYNLRRNYVRILKPSSRRNNTIVCVIVILLAMVCVYFSCRSLFNSEWLPRGVSMILSLVGIGFLLGGIGVLRQTRACSIDDGKHIRKNIVVCFDGTWNQPGQTDYGYLAETNVFKLFKMLKGEAITTRKKYYASQYKEYQENTVEGTDQQTAFYFHGVGNKVENSQLGQLFGGAFGMGADGVVDRAYLDVLSVYRPGDRIFVFGFSRGAAIARLFAGVIGRRGLPTSLWTLQLFGRHWTVWKPSEQKPKKERSWLIGKLGKWILDRFGWYKNPHKPQVEVLGCWDTVGSFGLAKNVLGIPFQKIDLLKDLTVSDCVKRAYHMVALDETRDAFEPTLMDPDPVKPNRIVEVWFSGSHCNVGGGYATDRLSDLALDFLLRHISSSYAQAAISRSNESAPTDGVLPKNEWFPARLPLTQEQKDDSDFTRKEWSPPLSQGKDNESDSSWGLYLDPLKIDKERIVMNHDGKRLEIDPDARGRLRESTGAPYSFAPRKLPIHAVIYDSVFDRMKRVLPVYAPQSLFDLNEELAKKREPIEKEVKRRQELSEKKAATDSEEKEKEWEAILAFSNEKLTIMKWSEYLKQEVDVLKDDNTRERKHLWKLLNPARELSNPPKAKLTG